MKNSEKYPKTLHFAFSESVSNDDKILNDISNFINSEIVITIKYDGENSSLESSGCFARTHSGPSIHPSADLLKSVHAQIKHKIPNNIQIFLENLFAVHSISYSELESYFSIFNVREDDVWLSWDDVIKWSKELNIPTATLLFRGKVSSEKELKALIKFFMKKNPSSKDEIEGVVVRVADSFNNSEFSTHVAKCVRKNHVTLGSDHWKYKTMIKNRLKNT